MAKKGQLLPSRMAKVVFTTLGLLGKQLLISLFISFVKFVWSKVTS
jgi:hypothetical protein